MTDRLRDLRRFWDQLAANDPLWAVLSDPAKKDRRWALREFMASGEREVALLFQRCSQLGLPTAAGTALDFGCGVGRLSQALARRFERVIGVDISPEMVEIARRLNQYPDSTSYVCSFNRELPDLVSAPVDFIYSNIVLQHVPPDLAVGCIADCLRILAPGGLFVFQLPSHRQDPSGTVTVPMPDPAYDAQLALLEAPEVSVPSAGTLSWRVRVTNTGGSDWRQADIGSLRAGNHWFDATGRFMRIQDDARANLPQVLRADDACDVTLEMTAPAEPGTYWVEIDVVHEGVSWFTDKGSRPLRRQVQVTERLRSGSPAAAVTMTELPVPDYPQDVLDRMLAPAGGARHDMDFPMFGFPQADVLDLLGRQGGHVRQIDEDPRAGMEWVSYRYFVTAGSPRGTRSG